MNFEFDNKKLKVFDVNEKYDKKIVLCLGFFDSVHKGHVKLFQEARKFNLSEVAVFTFSNNFYEYLNVDQKLVFDFSERLIRFCESDVDCVIKANFDKSFAELSGEDFINLLFSNFNIAGIVCGEDYRFSKNAQCGIDFLKTKCDEKKIPLKVVEILKHGDKKISSTMCRCLIRNGDILRLNEVLGSSYFFFGKVEKGYSVGKTMGFPTVNIPLKKGKEMLKDGVYCGDVKINGKLYKTLTNVGNRPTFDDLDRKVETHIVNYVGNLYDAELKVNIKKRIRDIKKFANKEELSLQISKDMEFLNYD